MQYLKKVTKPEVEKQAVTPEPDLIKKLFDDFEFEVKVEGRKTSEGDGRTAADIEREMALAGE